VHLGGPQLVGNATTEHATAKVGELVTVVAQFGERELSIPASDNSTVMSMICGGPGSATLRAAAPGTATVTVSTAGASGLAQASFTVEFTVLAGS